MTFKDKFILTVAIVSACALLVINATYDNGAGAIVECGVNTSC